MKGDSVTDSLRGMWWAMLAIGIIAILLGLVALFMPVSALKVIIAFIAVFAILTGVFAFIGGIRAIAHDAGGWLELLWGLVGIAIGLYVIFEPQTAAVVLFLLYGIWALLRGVIEVIQAIRWRHVVSGWVAMLVAGIAWAVLGVLFLVAPGAAAVATTMIWGLIVVFIGVATVVFAVMARKALHELDDAESSMPPMMQY